MAIDLFFGHLIEMAILADFLYNNLERKYSYKKTMILSLLIRAFSSLVSLQFLDTIIIKMSIALLCDFIYVQIVFKDKFLKKILFLFIFSLMGCFFIENLLMIILMNLKDINMKEVVSTPLYRMFICTIMYSFTFILTKGITWFLHRKDNNNILKQGSMIAIYSAVQYLLDLYILYVTYTYASINTLISGATILVISTIVLFGLIVYTIKMSRKQEDTKLAQSQLTIQKKHYDELNNQYENIENMKENIIDILDELENNFVNNNYNMEKQIEKLKNSTDNIKYRIYSGNSAIDAILHYKTQTANSNNIKLDIGVSKLKENNISDMELCSLISNLLDNAIEASQKEKEKFISFKIFEKDLYLVFKIVNKCSEFSESTKKQDKENHGLGLKIIEDIAKKHDGNSFYTHTEGIFTHIVNLKLKGG